jgi:hypothetical protein
MADRPDFSILGYFAALKAHVRELRDLMNRIDTRATPISREARQELRDKTADVEATVALITHRLRHLPASVAGELKCRVGDTAQAVLARVLNFESAAAIELKDIEALPLWGVELFGRDLRQIERLEAAIEEIEVQAAEDALDRNSVRLAKETLSLLIDRSPTIQDFARAA